MKEILDVLKTTYGLYNGFFSSNDYYKIGGYIVLFIIAIIWFYKNNGDQNPHKGLFEYGSISLAVALFPCTAVVVMDIILTRSTYYQIFWILPIIVIIAYVAAISVLNTEQQKVDKFTLLVFTVILCLSGVNPFLSTNYYKTNKYEQSENRLKIDNTVLEIADYITEYWNDATIISPPEISNYIRKYTAHVKPLYGVDITETALRTNYPPEIINLYGTLNDDVPNIVYVAEIANQNQCNIIIVRNENFNELVAQNWETIQNILISYGFSPNHIFSNYTMFVKV